LLARVPPAAQKRACICRRCVADFHQERAGGRPLPAKTGEFYFDELQRVVFTTAYHLRRGYCCENNCRHCPY